MLKDNEELTADTTFYALTAPIDGYRLEDQILGPLTLREWLRVHNGQDAEDDLAEELFYAPGFWRTEDMAMEFKYASLTLGMPEAFTVAALLNRLRLDGMEANEL